MSNSQRFQIVHSNRSLRLLHEIRELSEATSDGEVVRRALIYHEWTGAPLPPDDDEQKNLRGQIILTAGSVARLERIAGVLSSSEMIRRIITGYHRFWLLRHNLD